MFWYGSSDSSAIGFTTQLKEADVAARSRSRVNGPIRIAVGVTLALSVMFVSRPVFAAGSANPSILGLPAWMDGQPLGAMPATTPLAVTVVLNPRDQGALDQFVSSVSTPGSPSYGQYLAPGAFGGRFGASASVVDAVTAALHRDGLVTGPMNTDGLLLPARGTAGAFSRALGISFSLVRIGSGRVVYVFSGTPSLGSALSGDVAGFLGLTNATQVLPMVDQSSPRQEIPAPCSAATEVSPSNPGKGYESAESSDHYLTVPAIMKAYGADPLYDMGDLGQGVTIDLFEQQQPIPSDINTFDGCFGVHPQIKYFTVGGSPPPAVANDDSDSTSNGVEADLDIETLASAAPEASINVYESTFAVSETSTINEYAAMVDADNSQIISTSWGICEDGAELIAQADYLKAESLVFEQADAQGESVLAAAGDSGSEDCSLPVSVNLQPNPLNPVPLQEVDDPGSDPYVTSVGGTSLRVNGKGQRVSEVVWNEGPAYGSSPREAGGGGASHFWSMPQWQYSALSSRGWLASPLEPHALCVVSINAQVSRYCRESPDVSADAASNTGIVTYWDGSWTHFNGTSYGAPIWAAVTALSDDCARIWGRKQVGFLNPALYRIASNPTEYAEAFYDVTQGNNDYIDPSSALLGYSARPGYDMASGLGTPIAGVDNKGVVDQLCAGAPR